MTEHHELLTTIERARRCRCEVRYLDAADLQIEIVQRLVRHLARKFHEPAGDIVTVGDAHGKPVRDLCHRLEQRAVAAVPHDGREKTHIMLFHEIDEITLFSHPDIGFAVGDEHDGACAVSIETPERHFQACEEIGATIDSGGCKPVTPTDNPFRRGTDPARCHLTRAVVKTNEAKAVVRAQLTERALYAVDERLVLAPHRA